jgi:DNA polymerase-1
VMFNGLPLVFCDTEFGTRPDGRPDPRCAVFLLEDGTEIRFWEDELHRLKKLPFDIRNTAFVCYSAGAEIGVFLELGLALPHHVIDLYAEHLAITNGRRGKGDKIKLITLMALCGLTPTDVEEKKEMQALAMRGGIYSPSKRAALQDYCASDTYALKDAWLSPYLQAELAKFHPQEILFRGRFMVALARSHRPGVPIDAQFSRDLAEHRDEIAVAIATEAEAAAARRAEADPEHFHRWDIYRGARFVRAGYEDFLRRAGIPMPLTPKGEHSSTKREEFLKLEGQYPELTPLRECMGDLDALSNFDLPVDADDRVRLFVRPFGSVTGRSTKSLFSLPKWTRPMVKPPRGMGVAYLDARAQEHLVAAARSGDARMKADYLAGDVHQQLVDELGLTVSVGQKPRDRAKIINHATAYGQGVWGLAKRLGTSKEAAAEFLREHRRGRQDFYQWRQSIVNGLKHKPARTYYTILGWPFWAGQVGNERSMMNHPVQSDAADWMRTVMVLATESGIGVCLSAHDGFLIIAPVERLEQDIERMTLIMQAASEALFGIQMFVDCDEHARAVWPNRLVLGGDFHPTWNLVQSELRRIKQRGAEKAP